ncbi:hypothetical protein JIY74_36830 [Vibrio harveyi]|nr:hypothetical protein [Vibrio harveyi]
MKITIKSKTINTTNSIHNFLFFSTLYFLRIETDKNIADKIIKNKYKEVNAILYCDNSTRPESLFVHLSKIPKIAKLVKSTWLAPTLVTAYKAIDSEKR